MKLYMAVTADRYELPLAVADTTGELAALRGVNPNTLKAAISHDRPGGRTGEKYVRVEVEETWK